MLHLSISLVPDERHVLRLEAGQLTWPVIDRLHGPTHPRTVSL